MAKSQLSDEELAAGIASMGGFGSLRQKAKRDSPFGADYIRNPQGSPPAAPVPSHANPIQTAPQTASPLAPAPIVQALSPKEGGPETSPQTTPPRPAKLETRAKDSGAKDPVQGAHAHFERVTLLITPQMRDSLHVLAKTLQRKRRAKGERFTANTLIRVATQQLINTADIEYLSGVSSEDELLKEVGKRRR